MANTRPFATRRYFYRTSVNDDDEREIEREREGDARAERRM